MGDVINYCYFCRMRNIPNGFAGLDQKGQIPMKLLKTNIPGGVATLTKDPNPTVDINYLPTEVPGGLATLDENGKLRQEQLPDGTGSLFKGKYSALQDLLSAYPTAQMGDHAYISGDGYYYWNDELRIQGVLAPAWVRQKIAESDYKQLDEEAKEAVPYIITFG